MWPDLALYHLLKCGVSPLGQKKFLAANSNLEFIYPKKYMSNTDLLIQDASGL